MKTCKYPEHLNPFSSDYEDDDEVITSLQKEQGNQDSDEENDETNLNPFSSKYEPDEEDLFVATHGQDAESLQTEQNENVSVDVTPLQQEKYEVTSHLQETFEVTSHLQETFEVTSHLQEKYVNSETLRKEQNEGTTPLQQNQVVTPLQEDLVDKLTSPVQLEDKDSESVQEYQEVLKAQQDQHPDDLLQHESATSLQQESETSLQHEAATSLQHEAATSLQHESATSLQHESATSLQHEAATSLQHKTATSLQQESETSLQHESATSLQHKTATSLQHEAATSLQHKTATSLQHEAATSLQHESATSLQHEAATSLQHESATSLQHEAATSLQQESETSLQHESANSLQHESATSLQHEKHQVNLALLQNEHQVLSILENGVATSLQHEVAHLKEDQEDSLPKKPPRARRSVSLRLPRRFVHQNSSLSPSKFGKTRMAPSPPTQSKKLSSVEPLSDSKQSSVKFICNGQRSSSCDSGEAILKSQARKTSLNSAGPPVAPRSILRTTRSTDTSQSSIHTGSSLQTPCDSESSISSFPLARSSLKSSFSFKPSSTRKLSTSKSAPQLPSLIVKRIPSLRRLFRGVQATKFS